MQPVPGDRTFDPTVLIWQESARVAALGGGCQ